MVKKIKRSAFLLVPLAVLAILACWFWNAPTAPATAAATHFVTQKEAVSHGLALVGRVEPAESITLTAPFDGEILQRRFEEGQYVEQGQMLIELSSADMDIRLREAMADRLRTQATLRKLQDWQSSAELRRANRFHANATQNMAEITLRLEENAALYKKGIVAKMEVDSLAQQQRSARSELSAAQEEVDALAGAGHGQQLRIASLEDANAKDKYAALVATLKSKIVVAPFSGIVVKAPNSGADAQADIARTGSRVTRGMPLLGLASRDRVRIGTTVDEAEVRQLKQGQAVEVSGETFGAAVINGTIEAISSVPSLVSQGAAPRYDVKVHLPELAPEVRAQIRLGMSANIKMVTYNNPAAIVVPINAVLTEDGKTFVAVVAGKGGIERKQVHVTSTTEQNAEITGVPAGTLISVSNTR
ncbi:HlyD family efflux transporter periplasmic adaptor subunit [Janthinobacterium sp. GW458P]|uniref:efflux RND transporter periplasmic adaptor subunit n=1 Tax=Janthinobacterium sp. GW458P TaxID=1981504 RepID=UPI000A329184|nr:HlyD family efflux transporter periplasmic adaptor subunit [Janthinobacterium sp. GW458P]MBE3028010.1 HlyD family efflux transporter periplasmic adaptor subunit [Janthinobacterium sp. GW458P]PHV14837.1 hypothetical protein CSQ90_21460 [Janthinobacterium sp. BJB303]